MHAHILIFLYLFFISTSFGLTHKCNTFPDCPDIIEAKYVFGLVRPVPTGYVACEKGVCVTAANYVCGKCGEKPIDGKCCYGKMHNDGYCWCACGSGRDCRGDDFCKGNWCTRSIPGKTCGACGNLPIDGRCCGRGIVDNVNHTDKCLCDIGSKCRQKNDCKANFTCCSNGYCYPLKKLPCRAAGPGAYEL